jgi:hypothetical protein
MSYVGSEQGNKVKMIELARGTLVMFLSEGESERFVVREDNEMSSLQHVSEMFHGLIYSQQFAIIGAIFLLRCIELYGEESAGLPVVFDPLL